ncbi:ATP-binding protein [Basfia succiniciproducens]|uniref:ATP-binding protein n=1 Tax=Basfia succiniciproducens TaxID=653940 RepID=UPI000C1BD759
MKKWLKRLDISLTLQLSFLVSALLCLFVGVIGLYTWQQQRSEINFALDQNFPKVQAAFQMEEQVNILQNAFVHLINVKSTNEKIEWYSKSKQQISELHNLIIELDENLDDNLIQILQQQTELLEKLSDNISLTLTLNEELNKLNAKMTWLHNDFHNEFTALLQEMSWQQSTLANALSQKTQSTDKIIQLKQLQQQLLIVYDLTHYEEQIINELKNQFNDQNANPTRLVNYLKYLSLSINARIKQLRIHSSTYAIQQILNDLISIGLNSKELPLLFQQRQQLFTEREQFTQQVESIFHQFRVRIDAQVGNSKNQLRILHNIVEKSSRFSGMLILISMLCACILLIAVNFVYIRLRLLKRFELLNQTVVRLSNGEQNVKVEIYGNDELGRIARLLRLFLFEMNKKTQELEMRNQALVNEIKHRIQVETTLMNTQNELTQAAKLAVVGKTLTSISHEITQPLNAMNAYVFSAKRAIHKQDMNSTINYLDKISLLVERSALIIKRLRQFGRQGSGQLQTVNLTECIQNAWDLLESKHKSRQAKLIITTKLPSVLGEDVLFEQVFVNLFLNSLEAIEHTTPYIRIEIYQQSNEHLCLWITDNGKGWSLEQKLLQPFSSSKDVNLGLGLSISQSIMQYCKGGLSIASTLTHNALIILDFKVKKDV